MDYKQMAVYKEKQLKEQLEKLKEELEQEKAGRDYLEEQTTKTIKDLKAENIRLKTYLTLLLCFCLIYNPTITQEIID